MKLTKKTIEIINKKTIAAKHKTKKDGCFYQLYKIDFSKIVIIGGLKKEGYMLNFINGKKSNLCLTKLNILKIAHSGLEINKIFYTMI